MAGDAAASSVPSLEKLRSLSMDDVHEAHGRYTEWCEAMSDKILAWSRPEWVDAETGELTPASPTSGWPLTDFKTAFSIAVAFLVLVFLGRIFFGFSFVPSLVPPQRTPQDVAANKQANILLRILRLGVSTLRFTYNLTQMMLCGYMSLEAFALAYRHNYSAVPCNEFNSENPPLASLLWLFYLSKILDFVDTFLIVVGKKWRQLSFLHVYHHFSIFLFYWLNINVAYDGDIYFTILLNGFIHFVMYTYYFVSSHPGAVVWWKQYVTTFQLIQFVLMMSQAGYMMATDCQKFPPQVTKAYFGYIMTMFLLFSQFFVANYLTGSKGKKKSKTH